ncbi:hypothetical protein ISG33_09445 [Glaciecola sp. MH2013]|uniref:ATP-grasp domain-containing protein n=1 Tax=Glaciecola sp. MH2013 TaxID=2785524 RepID=UPI0018A1018E|nr:hypothetical protein [Glaciecola sp. MH2013]MBF7073617.1 hypothetical protein [Glaciecola sp. MH2013]
MRKLAILSTNNLEDFFVYDRMLTEPLAELGWEAIEVSWHEKNHQWNQYEAVIVRSTWDYQAHCDDFLNCLNNIDKSSAILLNPLKLIEWNISKRYLQDLEGKGVPIVPTVWIENTLELEHFFAAFGKFSAQELVIKPYISANADFTYRVKKDEVEQRFEAISSDFDKRYAMIQPFIQSVVEEGEYSLFYFDSQYSHAICKQPAQGDFRVQEEHGGELSAIEPSDEMFSLGNKTIAALPHESLYARVDMIRVDGRLVIIEVELIEPSLYFNMDNHSAAFFAKVFAQKYS